MNNITQFKLKTFPFLFLLVFFFQITKAQIFIDAINGNGDGTTAIANIKSGTTDQGWFMYWEGRRSGTNTPYLDAAFYNTSLSRVGSITELNGVNDQMSTTQYGFAAYSGNNNDVLAVWREGSNSKIGLGYYSVNSSTGNITPIFPALNPGVQTSDGYYDACLLDNGNIVWAYSQAGANSGTDYSLFYEILSPVDGSNIKARTEFISRTSGWATGIHSVQVKPLDDGGFALFWRDFSNGTFYTQEFDSNGNAEASPVVILALNTASSRRVNTTKLNNGNIVFSVETGENDAPKAFIIDYSGSSAPSLVKSNIELSSFSNANQLDARLEAFEHGGFVVTYVSNHLGGSTEVYYRIFDNYGNPANDDIALSSGSTNFQRYPDAATLSSGKFMVIWTDDSNSGGDRKLASSVTDIHPIVSLDADNSSGSTGTNYSTTLNGQSGGVTIADTDTEITDANGNDIQSIVIAITNPLETSNEYLTLSSATDISISGSGGHSITLTNQGNATNENFETALKDIRYENTTAANLTDRSISVAITDKSNLSASTNALTSVTITSASTPNAVNTPFLYWPNFDTSQIEKIGIDGAGRANLISSNGPVAVEVDLENQKLYWFQQSDSKIYQSNLDGTNATVFLSNPGYASTLFLDRVNGYLYWPNDSANKIERIKLDGTGREDVVSSSAPIAITADIPNSKIYWFNQTDTKIYRANFDGTNVEEFISNPGYVSTLYFDQSNSVLYWPNFDASKIEKINTDGTGRADVVSVAQPIAITVDIPNSKIYWFNQADTKVYRANLDGTSSEVFISNPGYASTLLIPYDITSIPQTITWNGITDNDWDTATNWNTNSVPTSIDNVVIPSGLSNYPTATGEKTVNSVTIASGATVIAKDGLNGTITYSRNLVTTNWYLVSFPVSGETVEDLRGANSFATGTQASNIGLAFYDTSGSAWSYYQTGATGGLTDGRGYSVKLSAAGDLTATGSFISTDQNVSLVNTGNKFNLLGNPFISFINGATFLTNETADLASQTVWLWNQGTGSNGAYDTFTPGADGNFKIAPGQGFWVEANSANSVTFTESLQSHESTDNFQKTAPRPEIYVHITDQDGLERKTRILYDENATQGFDNGYDGKLFGGASHAFTVFTQLLAQSQGEKYAVQVLPNADYETQIIPIGIIAAKGKQITFSAEALNLPEGIQVYLEDRENNSITELGQENNNGTYQVTLYKDTNGTGRFYLYTRNGVLSTDDLNSLSGVSIFSTDSNTLNISGVNSQNASLQIYNILGKEILNTNFSSTGSTAITLPKVSRGIYVVHLSTEKGKMTKKMVLE